MTFRTISFRARSEKIKQLDQIAVKQRRDRTFILNKAIDTFLTVSPEVFSDEKTVAAPHPPETSKAAQPRSRLSHLTPLDLINPETAASKRPLLQDMVSAWEKDWAVL